MLKRLSPFDLHKAIKKLVEDKTGLLCYDEVPNNAKSPFYFVQLNSITPDNTKTMWRDTYRVWIHAISSEKKGSKEIYEMINKLDEAMTEAITLPEGNELISQRNNGLQVLKTDETGEKHAVLVYEFKISYGFKMKI